MLNVEGKFCFYLLKNEYIDTAVQKGGVTGMPACIEHTGVVSQLLKDTKNDKGDMAVLWLDLKNAYRSIPHSLVEEALKRYHVPNKITELIVDYYNDF